MSPIEFVMLKQRKQVILAAGIVFASLWFILVVYLLMGGGKQPTTITPNVVAVHAPSVTGGGLPTATYTSPRTSSSSILHHSTSSPIQWSYIENMPHASMSSTSMRLYQTSSATVHSIGGGGAAGGIATTGGGNNSGKGVRYTAMAYSGSIYVPKARNAVTEVGASSANSEATTTYNTTQGPNSAPNIRRLPGHEEEWWLTPIGDVTWGLLILLAAGYGYHVFLRKRPQSKEAKR